MVQSIGTPLTDAIENLDEVKQEFKNGQIEWMVMVYRDKESGRVGLRYWYDDEVPNAPMMIGCLDLAKDIFKEGGE